MLHQSRQGRAPAVCTPTSMPLRCAESLATPLVKRQGLLPWDSESVTSSGPNLTRVSACPGQAPQETVTHLRGGSWLQVAGHALWLPWESPPWRVNDTAQPCPSPRPIAHQAPASTGSLQAGIRLGCHFLLQGVFPTQDRTHLSRHLALKRLTILHL